MDIDKICYAILRAPLRLSDHNMSHYTLIKTVLEQTAEHVRREYDAATRCAAGPAAQGVKGCQYCEQGEPQLKLVSGSGQSLATAHNIDGVTKICTAPAMPAAPAVGDVGALSDAAVPFVYLKLPLHPDMDDEEPIHITVTAGELRALRAAVTALGKGGQA